MTRKVILFELNEVPDRILDQFCRWHPRSFLASRLARCERYQTVTEDVGSLSPWITWPTLHRGVNNEKHLLSDFGQDTRDLDREHPPIWQVLQRQGIATGVGGSLHTYPMPDNVTDYAFYLPDTFAAGSECFPEVLSAFQAFNLAMARESARNISTRVPWAAALRLLRAVPDLGFRPQTALDLAQQVIGERLKPSRSVRRRTYQSVLAFDVFLHQLEKARPAFATFFTNHVASAMHRYWAAAFPEDYIDMSYKPEWIATYKDEIRFAMGKADQFLSRTLQFADRNPEYTVWITTSMGQAATHATPCETQLYVTDPVRFMTALGFASTDWSQRPAMLPQFNVAVLPARQELLRSRLEKLRIGDSPLSFRVADAGFVSMDFGHPNLEPSIVLHYDGKASPLASFGLTNVEIQDKSGTSAYHIPEGCLLVYDPRATSQPARAIEQVSTLEIVPTILKNFGVDRPSYLRAASHSLGGLGFLH